MEKHLALVDKNTKMIKSIIVVESYDNTIDWEDKSTLAIPDENHIAILYGSWDGENFIEPTEETLIELGVSTPIQTQLDEIDA